MQQSSAAALFVVDASEQHGIHCRFGQRGTIAEAHFDAGRNAIAVLRGRRRYILLPPAACASTALRTDGPSARHSSADWTAPDGVATVGAAQALEAVLDAGDVLYLPAYWLHYIVSLRTSMQCNTRSGTPPGRGMGDVAACGFHSLHATEEEGAFASTEVPLHHALAVAADGIDFAAAKAVPARVVMAMVAVATRFCAGRGGQARAELKKTDELSTRARRADIESGDAIRPADGAAPLHPWTDAQTYNHHRRFAALVGQTDAPTLLYVCLVAVVAATFGAVMCSSGGRRALRLGCSSAAGSGRRRIDRGHRLP